MSYCDQYRELRSLLMPLREIWGFSVLKSWPEMRTAIGPDLLQARVQLSLPEQYRFLRGEVLPQLPASVQNWQFALQRLITFPEQPSPQLQETPFDEGLNPKKNHEISAILEFLEERCDTVQQLIDIGGGAGHLARHLASRRAWNTFSIDRESSFQAKGRWLLQRRPWKRLVQGSFTFVTGTFPECLTDYKGLDRTVHTLSVGLHTCGPLAWHHILMAGANVDVLNFGCCYDKLQLDTDVERSSRAQEAPLGWTQEALFLATRGGKERSFEDFTFQARVQEFRFALHAYLCEQGFADNFLSVGQTPDRHYKGSFAAYVENRLQSLQISSRADAEEIETFRCKHSPILAEQWAAALLRNRLARGLEVLLILDRALWLEEKGMEVLVHQFFDPSLSPRNLGIYAHASSSGVV